MNIKDMDVVVESMTLKGEEIVVRVACFLDPDDITIRAAWPELDTLSTLPSARVTLPSTRADDVGTATLVRDDRTVWTCSTRWASRPVELDVEAGAHPRLRLTWKAAAAFHAGLTVGDLLAWRAARARMTLEPRQTSLLDVVVQTEARGRAS